MKPKLKVHESEMKHGRIISQGDPELIWGWGTPAGRLRAERRAGLIMEGARLSPGQMVLEIGCGTGLFTEKFAAAGVSILAVDLSPELLALAERRIPPAATSGGGGGGSALPNPPFGGWRNKRPF
jgi:2-polyprenyl-3-methyl-5-hydroxy-6-metoxy-1,4-benzoquinol methylase